MAADDKNTVSLLHFDSDLTDECGNKWTPTGACVVDKSVLKLGVGALYTPSGAYLSCTNPEFAFGTGDFTIDFWMKYSSGYSGVSSAVIDGAAGAVIQSDMVWLGASDGYTVISPSYYFVSNAWAHYALVRSAGTCYYFVNGILKATKTGCNINIASTTMAINSRYTTNRYVGGAAYYDEFRISNVARWTSDFIPPTEPYSPGTTVNAPTNLTATAGDSHVALSWTAVTGATGYNVKRSTTAGGPYTTIASNVSTNSYVDTSVTNGTTYYYVVTAVNADGESANSNEASATPQAQSGHSMLRITMSDSSEREYKLTTTEINDFVKWINQSTNTGNHCYTFNDTIEGSTEYLLFEKIISFKVIPLAK